jgi:molecular chaperone DnaJ
MTDYYKVLGINKGASAEEVKKAYKKLAKQYHPDVSSDPDAEKKFKEVVEAYQVLSDPEKKQNYDNYGDAYKNFQGFGRQGFGGQGGMDFDFEDIFSQFTGGGGFDFSDIFGGRGQRKRRDTGTNLKYNLRISFEEAAFGCEKEIEYDRIKKCEKCDGSGAKGGNTKTCSVCNGQGRVVRQQKTPFGIFRSQSTCPECSGSGEVAETKCLYCNGQGLVTEKEKIKVKVPAGINTGNHLKVAGKGHAGKDGESDLYVVIFVESHEIFKRDDFDIYTEVPISFSEAALGSTIEVPTLKGKAELKVPKATQTGTIFKMKNKGIKYLNKDIYGDEFVKVIVETPTKLSKKQKELLEKLSSEDKAAKKRKGLFEKILDKLIIF